MEWGVVTCEVLASLLEMSVACDGTAVYNFINERIHVAKRADLVSSDTMVDEVVSTRLAYVLVHTVGFVEL